MLYELMERHMTLPKSVLSTVVSVFFLIANRAYEEINKVRNDVRKDANKLTNNENMVMAY